MASSPEVSMTFFPVKTSRELVILSSCRFSYENNCFILKCPEGAVFLGWGVRWRWRWWWWWWRWWRCPFDASLAVKEVEALPIKDSGGVAPGAPQYHEQQRRHLPEKAVWRQPGGDGGRSGAVAVAEFSELPFHIKEGWPHRKACSSSKRLIEC